MEKILISGNSNGIISMIRAKKIENGLLRFVTVFFENANFFITKYMPLSNGVYLILEMEDGTELHVEGANCGYGGDGPHATLEILQLFGLEKNSLKNMIFENDAVRFEVKENEILWKTVDTSILFYPQIRERLMNKSKYNMICKNRNIDVDLEKRKIMIYNPQRTCWKGMLNLLSYMNEIEFEYYIGANSCLEGGMYLGKGFNGVLNSGMDRPDVKGVEHVNLVIHGSNFSIVCLIDREHEFLVVESVYLALTGDCLFEDIRSDFSVLNICKNIITSLKRQHEEIYGKKKISKKQMEKGLI